jgi:hypothetical protein
MIQKVTVNFFIEADSLEEAQNDVRLCIPDTGELSDWGFYEEHAK